MRSKIGNVIGSAIVAAIWSNQLPKQLRLYLPSNATEMMYRSFSVARLPFGPCIVSATLCISVLFLLIVGLYYYFVSALGVTFIHIVAACFQTNYFLEKRRMRLPVLEMMVYISRRGTTLCSKDQERGISPFLGWYIIHSAWYFFRRDGGRIEECAVSSWEFYNTPS